VNKSYKYPGTKVKKSGKQKFKNLGTKATKISKIWEQKSRNKIPKI
jgi:hypothetical protein